VGDEGPGGEGVGSDDSCAGEDVEETSGERLREKRKGRKVQDASAESDPNRDSRSRSCWFRPIPEAFVRL